MKRGLGPQGGYTIIEVIIFLTVSSALMASALYLFQGKIPRTQFTTSVNELNNRIRTTSNEVVSGYYPSADDIQCSLGTEATAGNVEQGKNEDCIVIGRAIQFAPGGNGCSTASPEDKCNEITMYTVYGDRIKLDGTTVTRLSDSKPRLLTGTGTGYSNIKLGYGLSVTKAYLGTSANQLSGVAFLQSFGGSTDAVTGIVSGAQRVQVHTLAGNIGESVVPTEPTGFVAQAQSRILNGSANPTDSVIVCLKSGTTGQYATITIGGASRGLSTSVDIYDTKAELQSRTQC